MSLAVKDDVFVVIDGTRITKRNLLRLYSQAPDIMLHSPEPEPYINSEEELAWRVAKYAAWVAAEGNVKKEEQLRLTYFLDFKTKNPRDLFAIFRDYEERLLSEISTLKIGEQLSLFRFPI